MLKLIIKYLLYLCAFVSVIMLLPGTILLDIHPKAFFHPLPKAFTGPLAPNEKLTPTEKLFENQLFGPESLATFNGKLVTGSADGYLYQIDGNDLKPLIKLVDESCATQPYFARCGRPLGLKFDSNGTLYVVEPNVGVFTVDNIFTDKPIVNLVFDIEQTGESGKPSKFVDDITIDEGAGLNGGHVLYISDVSVKFGLSEASYIILGSDKGRVIKYDVNAEKVESIAENLLFPNGMEITDDKTAVLVNEFVSRQVIKVYIRGPKTGVSEVLIKQLPGEPDNIRRSAAKEETYWLALMSGRNISKQNELDYYLKKPLFRKLVCRLFHLFGSGIEYVGTTFGNTFITEFGLDIKTGKRITEYIFGAESDNYAMIVEIDINGNIVNSLQSSDKTLTHPSEVREIRVNDQESILYIGSYINSYLGKLNFKR